MRSLREWLKLKFYGDGTPNFHVASAELGWAKSFRLAHGRSWTDEEQRAFAEDAKRIGTLAKELSMQENSMRGNCDCNCHRTFDEIQVSHAVACCCAHGNKRGTCPECPKIYDNLDDFFRDLDS